MFQRFLRILERTTSQCQDPTLERLSCQYGLCKCEQVYKINAFNVFKTVLFKLLSSKDLQLHISCATAIVFPNQIQINHPVSDNNLLFFEFYKQIYRKSD